MSRRTISLREGWRIAADRARAAGLRLDTNAAAAMRNGGDRRTEAKRELLRAVGKRAAAAGLRPFEADD